MTHSNQPAKELIDPDKIPCTECALFIENNGVCASDTTVKKIAEFIEEKTSQHIKDPEEVVAVAKDLLQCDSEACVLESREFLNTLESGEIEIIRQDLNENYKVKGPAETTQLLNNFHIDKTLQSWVKGFPFFYPIEFQFIDFSKYNTELETLDIEKVYNMGKRFIASVVNTDYTGNRGRHWTALACDMRDPNVWTIEFFNSSGNLPATSIVEWMMKIEMRMKKFNPRITVKQIIASKITHQKSKTECGPYCLYYIYNRLKGRPYWMFYNTPIPDERVTKFRKHLFRP